MPTPNLHQKCAYFTLCQWPYIWRVVADLSTNILLRQFCFRMHSFKYTLLFFVKKCGAILLKGKRKMRDIVIFGIYWKWEIQVLHLGQEWIVNFGGGRPHNYEQYLGPVVEWCRTILQQLAQNQSYICYSFRDFSICEFPTKYQFKYKEIKKVISRDYSQEKSKKRKSDT